MRSLELEPLRGRIDCISARKPWCRAHFDAFFATRGTVGTRSRAIRGSSSDDHVGCSVSRWSTALRRCRRCMSQRVFCRFCHACSRVPIVLGPFHYCASCERAAPDAPETIDDQRRCSFRCRKRRRIEDEGRRRVQTSEFGLKTGKRDIENFEHEFGVGVCDAHRRLDAEGITEQPSLSNQEA